MNDKNFSRIIRNLGVGKEKKLTKESRRILYNRFMKIVSIKYIWVTKLGLPLEVRICLCYTYTVRLLRICVTEYCLINK